MWIYNYALEDCVCTVATPKALLLQLWRCLTETVKTVIDQHRLFLMSVGIAWIKGKSRTVKKDFDLE